MTKSRLDTLFLFVSYYITETHSVQGRENLDFSLQNSDFQPWNLEVPSMSPAQDNGGKQTLCKTSAP